MREIDKSILEIAHAHGGVVTRSSLVELGHSKSAIGRRVGSGLLVPVVKGVYQVESMRTENSALFAGAAAYPNSAVARRSALQLYGMPVKAATPELLVAHGTHAAVPGLRTFQTRHLPVEDVVAGAESVGLLNLRICSVARALCDMAASESLEWLRHLVEVALTTKRTTPAILLGCAQERYRLRGRRMAPFLLLLADVLDDEPVADSVAELLLFKVLDAHGVRFITRQWRPPWYDGRRGIVDARDQLSPTIIEVDGRNFRQVTKAHENDRARDRVAAAHGFLTCRVGARELQRAPSRIGHELAELLTRRRAEAAYEPAA